MKGSYLGPEYSQNQIENELKSIGAVFETFSYNEMINMAATYLASEKVIILTISKLITLGPCRTIYEDLNFLIIDH